MDKPSSLRINFYLRYVAGHISQSVNMTSTFFLHASLLSYSSYIVSSLHEALKQNVKHMGFLFSGNITCGDHKRYVCRSIDTGYQMILSQSQCLLALISFM